MNGKKLNLKETVLLLVILVFAVTLAISAVFRTKWLPTVLQGKEWIQTLADLVQVILWIGFGVSLLYKYVLAASKTESRGDNASPRVSIAHTWQIGKGHKIEVGRTDADIRHSVQLGEKSKIIVEAEHPEDS